MIGPLYRFGPFALDADSGELTRAGRPVRLQPQPLKVLLRLVRDAGAVVSREHLQRELWGDDTFVDFDQGLNTCVRQIRLALGDSADAPRYIQTLQRRGYRFVAHVEAVSRDPGPRPVPAPPDPEPVDAGPRPAAVEPAPAANAPPETPGARGRRLGTAGRRPVYAAAAALALLVSGAAMSRAITGGISFSGPPGIRSMAVLPLSNLSATDDADYLADGLTEALIADLAQIKALRVISRTSVMRYRNANQRIADIARELDVDAVIEGTVTVSGSRIRVTAHLVDAARDRPVWSATYDRELGDALVLQREIARAVASEIRVRITPSEEQRLASARAVDPEAYRAYARGRALWNRRTTSALRGAIQEFERATALDPQFAAAWRGLAETWVLLGDDEYPAILPLEALARTTRAARRALELDEAQAGAWAALATVEYTVAWNWRAAERHFGEALLLAPGDASVHHWYAWFLLSQGRYDEAASAMAVARDLNPLSPIILTDAGYPPFFAGRHEEAIARFEEALAQDPHFVQALLGLGRAHERRGAPADALRAFERAVLLSDRATAPLTFLARAHVASGDSARARAILDELRARAADEYVPAMAFALIQVALGDRDAAIDRLEDAFAVRSQSVPYFLALPELQPLHGHPRFESLIGRIQGASLKLSMSPPAVGR